MPTRHLTYWELVSHFSNFHGKMFAAPEIAVSNGLAMKDGSSKVAVVALTFLAFYKYQVLY